MPIPSECHLSFLVLGNDEDKPPNTLNEYFPDKRIIFSSCIILIEVETVQKGRA